MLKFNMKAQNINIKALMSFKILPTNFVFKLLILTKAAKTNCPSKKVAKV